MRPCDGCHLGSITDQHTPETGATSCSSFTERLISADFSHHHKPTNDDLQMDAVEFSTILYLLMNHNQDLINFNLENKIIKNACVRTNSKGLDVKF